MSVLVARRRLTFSRALQRLGAILLVMLTCTSATSSGARRLQTDPAVAPAPFDATPSGVKGGDPGPASPTNIPSTNTSGVSTLSTVSYDPNWCKNGNCGGLLVWQSTCSDITTQQGSSWQYISAGTDSTGCFPGYTMNKCCVQVCVADYDCPYKSFCIGTATSGSTKYCHSCDSCGSGNSVPPSVLQSACQISAAFPPRHHHRLPHHHPLRLVALPVHPALPLTPQDAVR